MTASRRQEITQLLQQHPEDHRVAIDQLLPLVYDELRRMARHQLARERRGHTLDSVALVNEAYLKLVRQDEIHWKSRAHFFAVAARAMRSILIDYARKRHAAKRGGHNHGVPVDEVPAEEVLQALSDEQAEHLVALDAALTRLEEINEEACRMVEYHFFAGLPQEEAAVVLGLSYATARRRWSFAKAWLRRELRETE